MKTILEFEEEEEDYAHVAMHGLDLYLCIVKIDEWLRDAIKYPQEGTHEEALKAYDQARTALYEIMDGFGVNTEMLP